MSEINNGAPGVDKDELERRLKELMATVPGIKASSVANPSPIAVKRAQKESAGFLNSGDGRPAAGILINVDEDSLGASMVLYPPGPGERKVNEQDIRAKLSELGIVKGIKNEYILRLVEHTIYNKSFKVAVGVGAADGENGSLKCAFNTEAGFSKKNLENIRLDYRELDFLQYVKSGDELCEVLEATKGRNGYNIFGEALKAHDGIPISKPGGRHTRISEDGTRLYAECDGLVYLQDGKINVDEVKTVPSVDESTGDLEFEETVLINGPVKKGTTVKAGGNILVRGLAEGAVLKAGGNVILCRGAIGECTIEAGGSVRALLLENCEARVKDCIFADKILNSEIECQGMAVLSGARGSLIGGVLKAEKGVIANEVGASAKTLTTIEVGMRKRLDQECQAALQKLEEYGGMLKKLDALAKDIARAQMDQARKQAASNKLIYTRQSLQQESAVLSKRIEEISALKGEAENARVLIKRRLYPSVTVDIDGVVLENDEQCEKCEIKRVGKRVAVEKIKGFALNK